MNPTVEVPAALLRHSAIRAVRMVGSRAAGRNHDFSDWDFAVDTDDFASVAPALPGLVASLEPLAAQWDPYASHACYMLMLRGPRKVDLLFLDEAREWSPPWTPSAQTLEAIDRHFWDWIVWLEQKRTGGQAAVLESGLRDMFKLMLAPMGAPVAPGSVSQAIDAYTAARNRLERRYGVRVPRDLEREVRPAVRRRQTSS
jgi:hypothetical protein